MNAHDDAKAILCFGDSNTWGYNPHTQQRYPRSVRWTGVLARELGDACHVIAEGCNGRTTVWDDPIEGHIDGHKNGLQYLIPCLESHMPLDLVVLMLGTNDLKKKFSVGPFDIAASVGVLVDAVRRSEAGRGGAAPDVLVIVPPPLGRLSDFADLFEDGPEKSRQLSEHFRRMAAERRCHLLDAAEVLTSSDADGVHFDPEGHAALGRAVAARAKAILWCHRPRNRKEQPFQAEGAERGEE